MQTVALPESLKTLWSSPNYIEHVENHQGPRKVSKCIYFPKRPAASAITK